MSDRIGYVVIEWHQETDIPAVCSARDGRRPFQTLEAVEIEAWRYRRQAAEVGRRETYTIAEVVPLPDRSP